MAQIITKPGMFLPAFTQVRGMATLKDIRLRLKSIKNIQKITQSMKMVSAAKYARAERELKPARAYGEGGKHFYEAAEVKGSDQKPHSVIIAMTSDRGLCGAVHSNVVKRIKALIAEHPNPDYYKVICVGDKSRNILQRLHARNIMMVCTDYGKKPPTFEDARRLAQTVIQSEFEFDSGLVIYNKFRTVVSYRTSEIPIFHMNAITSSPKMNVYDSIDSDVLNSYQEFSLATLIYFAMKENACSEQSSRMSAMDSASKNAGEMIDKLTMKFNRTRQAVITKELIEIISGAAAL